jgi:hypothetical protein
LQRRRAGATAMMMMHDRPLCKVLVLAVVAWPSSSSLSDRLRQGATDPCRNERQTPAATKGLEMPTEWQLQRRRWSELSSISVRPTVVPSNGSNN